MTFLRRFLKRGIERQTLRWVNNERQRRGMEPLDHLPAGRRAESVDCVIARALSSDDTVALVRTWSYRLVTISSARSESVDFPHHVEVFVRAFDRGEYPHLIERSELHQAA